MRTHAQVGDLIQYRFGAFAARTVRRVIEIANDRPPGGDFIVEGGHRVPRSHVLTVIPMHEAAWEREARRKAVDDGNPH